MQHSTAYKFALVATILALFVIMLGAYTRATDAGLGCPDWPGCYGHMVAPKTAEGVAQVQKAYPAQQVNARKAWTEMVHRYFAGTLGLLVIGLGFVAFKKRDRSKPTSILLPLFILGLVIFQALLGKWTVTMKVMPVIVMGHLLGGLVLLAVVWWLAMRFGGYFSQQQARSNPRRGLATLAVIGLVILGVQLALGGWTSTNYAALACPDFPYCKNTLLPAMDFHRAFNVFMPNGVNFEGGVLDSIARTTIHVVHRFGALVTGLYLGGLALWLMFAQKNQAYRRLGLVMLAVLVAQIVLGILAVVWLLPLPIAVAHNGVAALLLMTVVTLNFKICKTNCKD